MKIAMLVKDFATTGGSNRYAVELSTRLARRGHEVHVYAQRWDPALVDGMTFHRVLSMLRPRFLNSLFYAFRVRSLTKSAGFDVIHSHQRTIYHHVISMHHPCYQSGCGALRLLGSPRHWVYRWLESRQFGCRPLTHVIAVSDGTKRDILARYPLDPSRVRVIHPGVDGDRMASGGSPEQRREIRARFGIGVSDLALILVGTEFKRKGLQFAIEAMRRLREEGRVTGALHLFVIGGGSQGEFRRQAAGYGLEGRVHFIGLHPHVEHYYRAADIFLLPTLNEPFGMAVLEAMAAGLPVIVSKDAGVAELLQHEKTTILLENPRNAEEIAAAVMRLSDARDRFAMGQRAREAVSSLTWERMADEIESLYREVVRLRAEGKHHSGLL